MKMTLQVLCDRIRLQNCPSTNKIANEDAIIKLSVDSSFRFPGKRQMPREGICYCLDGT